MASIQWSVVFRSIAEKLVALFPDEQTAGKQLAELLVSSNSFAMLNKKYAERLN